MMIVMMIMVVVMMMMMMKQMMVITGMIIMIMVLTRWRISGWKVRGNTLVLPPTPTEVWKKLLTSRYSHRHCH